MRSERQHSARRRLAMALFVVFACGAAGGSAAPPAPALPPALQDSDFRDPPAAQVALGRLLFFDPILSGNRNISCADCHHPRFATGDGLSVSLGEGGTGIGPERTIGAGDSMVEARVPRNSPALFNLGAFEFTVMFHDGRLERDPSQPGGFRNPLGADLPPGFDGALSMQAMFPVTSPDEMAGQYNENSVSKAARRGDIVGPDGVWEQLAGRLRENPAYAALFIEAFEDVDRPDAITFVHAANAMAAFIADAWRADDSPFDRYLRGAEDALSPRARRGMELFYGEAGCAGCHAGPFQTDHRYYAIAMPQIGPGKKARFETHNRDVGRMRVTGRDADAFRFRTPSLRNVALTAPYGHSGAYASLEAVVRHHLDPVTALRNYDRRQAVLPAHPGLADPDFAVMDDPAEWGAIAAANELQPIDLDDEDVAALIAFLHALTDTASLDLSADTPDRVPSGLPVTR